MSTSARRPAGATGLCLSGGAHREVMFHLGAVRALNEHGLLPELDHVAGVSGGAIVGATLRLASERLGIGADGRATRLEGTVAQWEARGAGRLGSSCCHAHHRATR